MAADASVGMLGRVLGVLETFDHAHPTRTLAEVARESGLPKATTHRILAQLTEYRLVSRDEQGRYRLGLRLFEIGERVLSARSLSDAALPIMGDLAEVSQRRVHLAVLDGLDVVYLEIVGGTGMKLSSRTGGRLPSHATGVGKAILAYSPTAVVRERIEAGLPRSTPRTIATPGDLSRELQKIRSVGMAMDHEESHIGFSCVAAPVFGSDRKVTAALSITGPTHRFDPGTLGPAVRTAAFTLSRALRDAGL